MSDQTKEQRGAPPSNASLPVIPNRAAKHASFYTPDQTIPSGTAKTDGSDPPKLFTPLKIRNMTVQNRIFVSPMCQYSADNGHHTKWHETHLGGIVQRGPGLTMVEASAVVPQGRITPEDSGIWTDSQKAPIQWSVDFAHSQNQLIAIQLAHAGRKASTVAPWLSAGDTAVESVGGWPDDVWAPSAIAFSEKYPTPKALSKTQISEIKDAFVAAAKRCLDIGFDAIELHSAHGYLFHTFLSPVSNKRTDEYGGSFENRTRFLVESVDAVRAVLPKDYPLFVRISATDWLDSQKDEFEDSWKISDSIKLADILAEHGVDVLDVSSGGLHPKQDITVHGAGYQAGLAKSIKEFVGDKLLVTAVGAIVNGPQAEKLLEEGLDAVFVGRFFQKNPGLVWTFAEELGVEIQAANQINWGFKGRAGGTKKK